MKRSGLRQANRVARRRMVQVLYAEKIEQNARPTSTLSSRAGVVNALAAVAGLYVQGGLVTEP